MVHRIIRRFLKWIVLINFTFLEDVVKFRIVEIIKTAGGNVGNGIFTSGFCDVEVAIYFLILVWRNDGMINSFSFFSDLPKSSSMIGEVLIVS